MSFIENILQIDRPSEIDKVALPYRQNYFQSPIDWRDEILYFLLPDRFSDGLEDTRPLYDRANPSAARPPNFRWDHWSISGSDRFQGGTIKGITTKLDYLEKLGVTTIWVGPVFKQRGHLDTYHGYAIQDFLEVDERFGTRQDLVDLVAAAHAKGLRVILDIIFNHSGHNWDYENGQIDPKYREWPEHYQIGAWIDAHGKHLNTPPINGADGVWPRELQSHNSYTRAGKGNLGGEDIDNDHSVIKRSDFDGSFRDFNFDGSTALANLARCYKYWIALTDCDGFRLDTLKHIGLQDARSFCGNIKEYASNLGKVNFFLVGEVGGPDDNPGKYLDILELNLNAALDIGPIRNNLHNVAKGLSAPSSYSYLNPKEKWLAILGSHRNSAPRHVTILDDHDHVSGNKVRFSCDAKPEHQVVAGVAIQLFSLGIPCIYYGTEQAFAGPERTEREKYLPDFGISFDTKSDRYLRETMFGALHPRQSGRAGLDGELDENLPGFGAFGSVGVHFFDPSFHVYRRIKALAKVRNENPVFRYGRQYLREISNFNRPFSIPANGGELIAWSRILDEEEGLCIVNGNGLECRGGDVLVSLSLNTHQGAFFRVIANTAQAIAGPLYNGMHSIGNDLPVMIRNGTPYIEIRNVGPSEVLILSNKP